MMTQKTPKNFVAAKVKRPNAYDACCRACGELVRADEGVIVGKAGSEWWVEHPSKEDCDEAIHDSIMDTIDDW